MMLTDQTRPDGIHQSFAQFTMFCLQHVTYKMICPVQNTYHEAEDDLVDLHGERMIKMFSERRPRMVLSSPRPSCAFYHRIQGWAKNRWKEKTAAQISLIKNDHRTCLIWCLWPTATWHISTTISDHKQQTFPLSQDLLWLDQSLRTQL